MGIMDAFSKEDRIEMTVSQAYELFKEAGKVELLMNGIKNCVPHEYMEVMMTGEARKEPVIHIPDITPLKDFMKEPATDVDEDEDEDDW